MSLAYRPGQLISYAQYAYNSKTADSTKLLKYGDLEIELRNDKFVFKAPLGAYIDNIRAIEFVDGFILTSATFQQFIDRIDEKVDKTTSDSTHQTNIFNNPTSAGIISINTTTGQSSSIIVNSDNVEIRDNLKIGQFIITSDVMNKIEEDIQSLINAEHFHGWFDNPDDLQNTHDMNIGDYAYVVSTNTIW
jgi:hypothetical protein